MPNRMVTIHPPGSRPGMRNLATAPTINPKMIHPMIPICVSLPLCACQGLSSSSRALASFLPLPLSSPPSSNTRALFLGPWTEAWLRPGDAGSGRLPTSLAILVESDCPPLCRATPPQFLAARIAQLVQRMHRLVVQDFHDIVKGLVRCEIRLDDHAYNSVGVLDNPWRRQHAHLADQRREVHQL